MIIISKNYFFSIEFFFFFNIKSVSYSHLKVVKDYFEQVFEQFLKLKEEIDLK